VYRKKDEGIVLKFHVNLKHPADFFPSIALLRGMERRV